MSQADVWFVSLCARALASVQGIGHAMEEVHDARVIRVRQQTVHDVENVTICMPTFSAIAEAAQSRLT